MSAAVLAGDASALRALVALHPESCTRVSSGIGGPPACNEDENDGQAVEVLLALSCEGHWLREEDVDRMITALLDEPSGLVAAYAEARPFLPATRVVLFQWLAGPRQGLAWAVGLDGGLEPGRVVYLNSGCAGPPSSFLQFWRVTDFILPPP